LLSENGVLPRISILILEIKMRDRATLIAKGRICTSLHNDAGTGRTSTASEGYLGRRLSFPLKIKFSRIVIARHCFKKRPYLTKFGTL